MYLCSPVTLGCFERREMCIPGVIVLNLEVTRTANYPLDELTWFAVLITFAAKVIGISIPDTGSLIQSIAEFQYVRSSSYLV